MAKKVPAKRTILYIHIAPSLKKWLQTACKNEAGHVSMSTMVQRILSAAKENAGN